MTIPQEPFVRYNIDKPCDTFTVKLNEDERKFLEQMKKIIEQEKDSTAFKQLAWIGAKVLLDQKTAYILETVFENKRKNKRLGIITFEP